MWYLGSLHNTEHEVKKHLSCYCQKTENIIMLYVIFRFQEIILNISMHGKENCHTAWPFPFI